MSTPISDIQKEEVKKLAIPQNDAVGKQTSANFIDMIDYKNLFFIFVASFISIKVSLNDVQFLQRYLQYQDFIKSLITVLLYYVFKFFLA
jgi:hypothetical protein